MVFITNKSGKPTKALSNVVNAISKHASWEGVVKWSEFHNQVMICKPPPFQHYKWDKPKKWEDSDTALAAMWFELHQVEMPTTKIDQGLMAAAQRNSYHPIRDYLNGLPKWDGVDRTTKVFIDHFGADNTEYTQEVSRCWLVSMVARVLNPGQKVDHMIVLEGAQGMRKSSGLRALMPDPSWFSDTPLTIGNKDAYQALRGVWLYELAELDSFKGKEFAQIKAFLSAPVDKYRPSYGRHDVSVPRQVVFAGTTNESHYLSDRTGGRRFWPVRCSEVNLKGIEETRDQLWAEALHLYRAGHEWWLGADVTEEAMKEQAARRPDEMWADMIRQWSSGTTPSYDTPDGLTHQVWDNTFQLWQVAAGALNMPSHQMSGHNALRLRQAMLEGGMVEVSGRWHVANKPRPIDQFDSHPSEGSSSIQASEQEGQSQDAMF